MYQPDIVWPFQDVYFLLEHRQQQNPRCPQSDLEIRNVYIKILLALNFTQCFARFLHHFGQIFENRIYIHDIRLS